MKINKRTTKKDLLKQIRIYKKRAREYQKMYMMRDLVIDDKDYHYDRLLKAHEDLLSKYMKLYNEIAPFVVNASLDQQPHSQDI